MEVNTNIKSGDVKIKESETGKETIATKEPDLVTRVSQVKEETKTPETKPTESTDDSKFDFKELENIKDPEAKAWAEKAYKSFQADYTNKTKVLAEDRKEFENSKVQTQQPATWTPERLQQELNKPDFVESVQSVIQPAKDEEYSALSETERADIKRMKQELLLLKEQNSTVTKQSQDTQLKGTYANYDSRSVDTLTADLLSGKVQATREHLWKVMDYDDAVHRAYKLGLEDKKLETTEKITSMSPEGTVAQATEGALEKKEGETSKQWFLRNAINRLLQSKEKGQTRK